MMPGFGDHIGDVFSAFFNDDIFSRGAGNSRRSKNTVRALPVTLKDLYNGSAIEIPHLRAVPCVACHGRGVLNGKSTACSGCRGSGSRMLTRQMGMMIQQMTVSCDMCGGTGRRINPQDLCQVCEGQRTSNVESVLTVVVEPGMEHKEQIVFRGEGDFQPQAGVTGDIVIVLEQVKDNFFERDGDDLYYTHNISLEESLCGFQFVFTHLDGRKLIVRRERGEITKPGETKVIVGEGMPVRGSRRSFGDLVMKFVVDFPQRLELSQVEILRRALPPPKSVDHSKSENAEECFVSRQELDHLREELGKEVEDREEAAEVGCTAQ